MDTIFLVFTPKAFTPNQEYVSAEQLERMRDILTNAGFRVYVEEYAPDTTVCRLARLGSGLIFNLAYGWSGSGKLLTQPEVAAELEQLGMPIVGSSSAVQALAQDKLLCGRAAERAGISAPRELKAGERDLPGIAIVKPRFGACHRGVRIVDPRQHGNVPNESELLQEYIAGEEYTVGVLERAGEMIAFDPIHVKFDRAPAIMDWDKYRWRLAPAPDASNALSEAAKHLFKKLSFKDYARFDFRMRGTVPVLLDANSLPNLHPEISLLPMAALHRGLNYSQLIVGLADNALSGDHARETGIDATSARLIL